MRYGQATRYSAGRAKCPTSGTGNTRAEAGAKAPSNKATVGAQAVRLFAAAASLAVAGLAGRWTTNRFSRFVVEGNSMLPALAPGDRLLVLRTRSLRPGDVVVVPDPRQPERPLVKRISRKLPGGLELTGDNKEHSTDSRQFGLVPLASAQGRAIYRYAPASRAGRLVRNAMPGFPSPPARRPRLRLP